jgi:hypothetical protein
MSQTPNIQLGSLEYTDIKNSIIEHLKSQDTLKDYDYSGSVAQVLLDILAYNTLYYGFYANMIASEMFLDTAQKEESIISLVKPLGYVVPGRNSARARVKIRHGGADGEIPRYTKFIGYNSSGIAYSFYTIEKYALDSDGENIIDILEGNSLIKEEPLSVDEHTQKGFLYGTDIDITTIRLDVKNSDGEWEEWTIVNNIQAGLDSFSKVFWLERTELGFFIVFGSNFDSSYNQIGQSLTPNQEVRVSYLKSSGTSGNNIGSFEIQNFSGVSTTTTTNLSAGGSSKPDLEAIRFFAPKWFASQGRAVTIEDCRGILAESGIVGSAEDAYSEFIVWGGEEEYPPRYGRLFVSLKESNIVDPVSAHNAIKLLEEKTCVTIIPEFMNVESYKLIVSGTLLYEPMNTQYSSTQLLNYSIDKIKENYPSRFKLENVDSSTMTTLINSVDTAIVTNSDDISLKLMKVVNVNSDGSINSQSFNNKCKESSLESDWFKPSDTLKTLYNIPNNTDIKINCIDLVNKDGWQKINAYFNSGGVTNSWTTGKWNPDSGEVTFYQPISADNEIYLYVGSGHSGSDKFDIKYNMYASGIIFDLSIEPRG